MRSTGNAAPSPLWTVAVLTAALAGPTGAARAEEAQMSRRFGPEDLTAGFQAVERWQIDRARGIAEQALAELPDHALTLALVGEVKLHLGDYAGAKRYFERAREAGAPEAFTGSEPLAERARVATEGYEEAVGEHFVIRYSRGKDAILLPYAFDTLDRARERIGELLGWRPGSRIIVELYPSAGTLAQVSTLTKEEIDTSGTIALCKWNRLMVTSPRGVVFGYSWRDTIAHELTHLIIGGASANSVPIWLHEGIAKYAETAWRGEPGDALSVEQQTALRDAARKGKLIPFEKMHPSMAKLKSQEETSLAFAEVFTFIEFLVKRRGWEGMRAVLARMREGAPDEQAIAEVHGRSLRTLSEEWMASLKTREVRTGRGIEQASPKIEVKDRADAPDDVLHGVDKRGRRHARAADLLFARGRVRAAQLELDRAYKESASPLISAKLAMLSLALGDLDAAETAARNAIRGTQDLAGPNVTLAQILVRRGKHAEALEALARAIAVNPFDPRIHELEAEVHRQRGDTQALARTEAARALLAGGKLAARDLGKGGLVEVDGAPFSRVYLTKGEGGEPTPTGTTTPGAVLELAPGRYRLELVPPRGEPIRRRIDVLPTSSQGAPQRISPSG